MRIGSTDYEVSSCAPVLFDFRMARLCKSPRSPILVVKISCKAGHQYC